MKYEHPQLSPESKTRLAAGKLAKRKVPYQGRLGLFIAECERCSELLAEYISAANTIIDIRQSHLPDGVLDSEMKKKRKLRDHARKSLLNHKRRTHQYPFSKAVKLPEEKLASTIDPMRYPRSSTQFERERWTNARNSV